MCNSSDAYFPFNKVTLYFPLKKIVIIYISHQPISHHPDGLVVRCLTSEDKGPGFEPVEIFILFFY